MAVVHDFVDIKCDDDDQKGANSPFKDSIAHICVGTTGTGKSSLISLFCHEAKVGNSTESETTSSSMFAESSKRSWLDSQGANDSKGVDDKKVLTDVLRELYKEKINQFKVVWCVSGDMDRNKHEFQTQAKFIKEGLGDGDNSIWDCCLIVHKRGKLRPNCGMDGVLAAAKAMGADIGYADDEQRLIGFSYFDPDNAQNNMSRPLELIFDMTEPDTPLRAKMLKKQGYLTREEIKDEVNQRLQDMKPLQIAFKIQQCTKCGNRGDPRFVHEKCHVAKKLYHPMKYEKRHKAESPTAVHPSAALPYHRGALAMTHPEPFTQKCHPGKKDWIHVKELKPSHTDDEETRHTSKSPIKFHPGKLERYHARRKDDDEKERMERIEAPRTYHTRKPENYHPGKPEIKHIHKGSWKRGWKASDGKQFVVGLTLFAAAAIYDGDHWDCCGAKSYDSKGCESVTRYTCCNSNKECASKYPCCGYDVGSKVGRKGCTTTWPCCSGPELAKGCQQTYTCCGEEIGAEGCKKKYTCCDAVEGTAKFKKGCTGQWKCCKMPAGSKGGCVLQYECCGKEHGARGCKWRYLCCKGVAEAEGCTDCYACCQSTDENSSGCQLRYTCCDGVAQSAGCGQKYGCCDKDAEEKGTGCKYVWPCCEAPKLDGDHDNSRQSRNGCTRVYLCCDKEEGSVEGCKEQCRACTGEWGGKSNGSSVPPTPNGCTFPTNE